MEQTFLYEVRPHRPIVGLSGVQCIRHPKSLYLTKEDVLVCLKNATVYRRFANLGKLERVTVTNVDRLHNENFIPEGEEVPTVEEPINVPVAEPVKVEEPVVEPAIVPEESKVQESESEVVEPEADDTVEEKIPADSTVANEEENSDEVDSELEEDASDEVQENTVENNNNSYQQARNNNQQYSNRHHKHKK